MPDKIKIIYHQQKCTIKNVKGSSSDQRDIPDGNIHPQHIEKSAKNGKSMGEIENTF